MAHPIYRPRRLRDKALLRKMVRETALSSDDLIYPLFVVHGRGLRQPIAPMPGQYRLSVGSVYQNFTRFEEVTRVLSRVRGLHVADSMALKRDITYQAAMRMRLDTSQLPKPFQVNAIASRDWTLTSDWHRWSIGP